MALAAGSSFWKPFMTERTTISAVAPNARPGMEISAMKEMKRLGTRVAQSDEEFTGHWRQVIPEFEPFG